MSQPSGVRGAVSFGPFQLNGANGPLYRSGEDIVLRPMPLAMLWFLVNRPDQVIAKEELLETVWPNRVVSESSLAVCISEIRAALDDDSRNPRYLQTIHRIGYRFIGNIGLINAGSGNEEAAFVGRKCEMRALQEELTCAAHGKKRMVLVSGNPGLGKSSLLDHWAAEIANTADVTIFRGWCINHTSTDAPYSPFISALRNLSRTEYSETLLDRMRRFAPDWLLQFPSLVSEQERDAISAKTAADAGIMLNELSDLLSAFSRDNPLILILDDMQWCDASSAVALSALMTEQGEQRILIVVASRFVDTSHVLASTIGELKIRHLCSELILQPLSDDEVDTFLNTRMQEHSSHLLTSAIYQRTQGHPLFTVALADHLSNTPISADTAREISEFLPANLHTYIELGLAELTHLECKILEIASVIGEEFSVAEIENALDVGESDRSVDEICESLARRGNFVVEQGYISWPDKTVTSVYRFVHALYPEIIRRRIGAVRLLHTHRQIAQRLQAGYATDRAAIALKLAFHYENANNAAGAAQCCNEAATVAIQRHANHEAIALLQRGLSIIEGIADKNERAGLELDLLLALGPIQIAMQGYGATEVQTTFTRARQLCELDALAGLRFPVLRGLAGFYVLRGEYSTAYDLGAQLPALAHDDAWTPDSVNLEGAFICGVADFFRGRLVGARTTLQQAIEFYDPQQHASHASLHGLDPGAAAYGFAAISNWLSGDTRTAMAQTELSVSCALASGHPYTVCQCHALVALLHQIRGDTTQTLLHSDQAVVLARQHSFPYLIASEQARSGWADAVVSGNSSVLPSIQAGMSLYRETGAVGGMSVLSGSMIEACLATGELDLGLEVVCEALQLPELNSEGVYRAELQRLYGELLVAIGGDDNFAAAEQLFNAAIVLAGKQSARCFQVRATASLANVFRRTNRIQQASQLISPLKDELILFATTPELIAR